MSYKVDLQPPNTLFFLVNKLLSTTSLQLQHTKGVGGRHFGTSVHVDKHGVRRGPWRFSLGKFSCFRR
ncbi:hypothetical protein LB506_008712 [Fusarium annulatum]|nr:hypothetical protein LB506_008712 [Fusarium annulatum]